MICLSFSRWRCFLDFLRGKIFLTAHAIRLRGFTPMVMAPPTCALRCSSNQ